MRKFGVVSVLLGGEVIKILIVDDGSTDATTQMQNAYQLAYPSAARVIHQVNGGYRSTIITSLRNVLGTYFKVADLDDWIDLRVYFKGLSTLEYFEQKQAREGGI